MSMEHPKMDDDEARRKAMERVRFELGTFVRLGQGTLNKQENEYQFPLKLRSPKVILDAKRQKPVDVRYLSGLDLGRVTVDCTTGEVERPNRNTIKKKIRDREKELERAVQKALISASGDKFSHLPFPENQYAPLEDILAQLILEDEIPMAQIEMMDHGEDDKYKKYVDSLADLDLVRVDNRVLRSGDVLITILQDDDISSEYEALNAAVGKYFQQNLGEFKMIKRTLGPYLAIAGYYYRRALELEEMPAIKESDLRRAIESEYSGRRRDEKLFKLSRYLLQLEDVGILESVPQNGERYWMGNEDVRDAIRTQSEYIGPLSELVA